jgi:hypothetical protein
MAATATDTYNRDRHICRLDLLLWVSLQPAQSGKRGEALCISYDFYAKCYALCRCSPGNRRHRYLTPISVSTQRVPARENGKS